MFIKIFRNRNLVSDSELELKRYDKSAQLELQEISTDRFTKPNHPEFMEPIFAKYYEIIRDSIKPGMKVLEIGAGTGNHTKILYDTGAHIVAQDISKLSLNVLQKKISQEIEIMVSRMEEIPVSDRTFDFIVCCNVLSYGIPEKVNQEIFRLLKYGGNLLILDSLNHNLAYKMNRRLHYYSGRRTKSTLNRVPDKKRIIRLSKKFNSTSCYFFGSYFWITVPLKLIFGGRIALAANKLLERIKASKYGAFKFILLCENYSDRQKTIEK